ncbi:hypothetical protein N9B73_13765, partial [Verrucomicrobiales bacterium]|nr:hypothetical protein [Verrucomicrobiales bacterium]
FANENAPGNEAPYRAYAAFVAVGEERDGLIADQEIRQISNWKTLPQGAVFVTGSAIPALTSLNRQPSKRLKTCS